MEPEFKPLTHRDLVELAGDELPERTAMSLLNANLAAPIDAAVAATLLADRSIAFADWIGER
jgi:hypothetical protein